MKDVLVHVLFNGGGRCFLRLLLCFIIAMLGASVCMLLYMVADGPAQTLRADVFVDMDGLASESRP